MRRCSAVREQHPGLYCEVGLVRAREAVPVAIAGLVGHLVRFVQLDVLDGRKVVLPSFVRGSFLLVSVDDKRHGIGWVVQGIR